MAQYFPNLLHEIIVRERIHREYFRIKKWPTINEINYDVYGDSTLARIRPTGLRRVSLDVAAILCQGRNSHSPGFTRSLYRNMGKKKNWFRRRVVALDKANFFSCLGLWKKIVSWSVKLIRTRRESIKLHFTEIIEKAILPGVKWQVQLHGDANRNYSEEIQRRSDKSRLKNSDSI